MLEFGLNHNSCGKKNIINYQESGLEPKFYQNNYVLNYPEVWACPQLL